MPSVAILSMDSKRRNIPKRTLPESSSTTEATGRMSVNELRRMALSTDRSPRNRHRGPYQFQRHRSRWLNQSHPLDLLYWNHLDTPLRHDLLTILGKSRPTNSVTASALWRTLSVPIRRHCRTAVPLHRQCHVLSLLPRSRHIKVMARTWCGGATPSKPPGFAFGE
jgi:hypothetical protein